MRHLAVALLVAACHEDIASYDSAFWNGGPMHCAVDFDTSTRNDLPSIESALDRARDRGEIVELYAHDPGGTVAWSQVEAVLAGARDRGLAFYTYADFLAAPSGPGIALSFDDAHVADWIAGRDMFARYNARLTFFIAYFPTLSATDRDNLHVLAGDGHDIEPHSINHHRAPDVVERIGMAAFLRDEVDPSIDDLRGEGFEIHAYAYPFGARTAEIDRALYDRVPVLRSVAFAWSGVYDPCPL